MPQPTNPDNEDDDEQGESGSGEFGRPQLKPNLEALFDPHGIITEAHLESAEGAATTSDGIEHFGAWELHPSSLKLFHRQLKKKLMLAQLDSASKMMKVIVGLSTQSSQDSWDIENLIKAMDQATHAKFNRSLYQIIATVSDSTKLDWKSGTFAHIDTARPPSSGL